MKLKNYLDKHEKICKPLDKLTPQLNILRLIALLSAQIGGDFNRRVSEFIDKEKEIILNTEINEDEQHG